MSEVCDAPEWSPILRRGQFAVQIVLIPAHLQQRVAEIQGAALFAMGICKRPDKTEVQIGFETFALVKDFLLQMRPTAVMVNGKSAMDLCFPTVGDIPGGTNVH